MDSHHCRTCDGPTIRQTTENAVHFVCCFCGTKEKTHKDKVDETEGTLKSTKIKVVEKTADKIGKTFEERLQALLFQQGKCLILLLRFPQRILHVLGSLFNSYLKLHLPESAFFNQPTQDGEDTDMEEEALPDTGNMFDDMFSASQTQERQQAARVIKIVPVPTSVYTSGAPQLHHTLILLHLAAELIGADLQLHTLIHMANQGTLPYHKWELHLLEAQRPLLKYDSLSRTCLELRTQLRIPLVHDTLGTATPIWATFIRDLNLPAEVFDNVRSLYQNCPLKKRKVKHPNKEPKMQLERIPILMAYLIVVLKLMFGFVDVDFFHTKKNGDEELEEDDDMTDTGSLNTEHPILKWLLSEPFAIPGSDALVDPTEVQNFLDCARRYWHLRKQRKTVLATLQEVLARPIQIDERTGIKPTAPPVWELRTPSVLTTYPKSSENRTLLKDEVDYAHFRLLQICARYITCSESVLHRYVTKISQLVHEFVYKPVVCEYCGIGGHSVKSCAKWMVAEEEAAEVAKNKTKTTGKGPKGRTGTKKKKPR